MLGRRPPFTSAIEFIYCGGVDAGLTPLGGKTAFAKECHPAFVRGESSIGELDGLRRRLKDMIHPHQCILPKVSHQSHRRGSSPRMEHEAKVHKKSCFGTEGPLLFWLVSILRQRGNSYETSLGRKEKCRPPKMRRCPQIIMRHKLLSPLSLLLANRTFLSSSAPLSRSSPWVSIS